MVINGENLDLIVHATFTGTNEKVNPTSITASSATINVPVTAETGEMTVHMANGESVAFPAITVDKPSCAYIPNLPGFFTAGMITEVDIVNGNLLSSISLAGNPVQYINNTSTGKLTLNIPSGMDGIFPLTITSTNGSITYDVKVLPREITIWEGPIYITWGDGGRVVVMASEFEGLTAGTKMRFYFDQVENVWAQAQISNGSWGGLVFSEIGSNTLVPTDIFGWE